MLRNKVNKQTFVGRFTTQQLLFVAIVLAVVSVGVLTIFGTTLYARVYFTTEGEGGGGGSGPSGSYMPPCPYPPAGYAQKATGIPSGSLCRGACGEDCDSDACVTVVATIERCVQSVDGTQHRQCNYPNSLACGSHPGCVTHDNCYDFSYSQPDPEEYRRSCDAQCVADWDPVTCFQWWGGGGPQPDTIVFVDPPVIGPILPGPCLP